MTQLVRLFWIYVCTKRHINNDYVKMLHPQTIESVITWDNGCHPKSNPPGRTFLPRDAHIHAPQIVIWGRLGELGLHSWSRRTRCTTNHQNPQCVQAISGQGKQDRRSQSDLCDTESQRRGCLFILPLQHEAYFSIHGAVGSISPYVWDRLRGIWEMWEMMKIVRVLFIVWNAPALAVGKLHTLRIHMNYKRYWSRSE